MIGVPPPSPLQDKALRENVRSSSDAACSSLPFISKPRTMRHARIPLLMAALILGGAAAYAGPRGHGRSAITDIHQALRKAPQTSIQVGDARYSLVNARYETFTSRKSARREGNYVKCMKAVEQGWSVVILTPTGTRLMEGRSLDPDGRVLDGDCVYYDANGQLRACGRYVRGFKTGAWSRYGANGRQLSDRDYYGEDWEAMELRVGLATMTHTYVRRLVVAEF